MISETKRKKLEAAGYSISKSGKTVQNDIGTVAGINSNGEFFGSGKAFSILKGEESKESVKSKSKPKTTSTTTVSSRSSAPKESKRPKQRQMGRGEPNYGEPKASPMGSSTRQSNKPKGPKETPTRDRREGTTLLRSPSKSVTYSEWDSMSRAERRAAGLPESILGWQNQNWVSGFKKWKERISGGGEPSKGSSSRRSTRGMAKGGMVRKGNTSYKDKGMFYKSASPRGYK